MPIEAWLGLAGGTGLLVALLVWFIYRAGAKDAESTRLKEENEVSNAQKDALVNQPRTDDALADKLRNGNF